MFKRTFSWVEVILIGIVAGIVSGGTVVIFTTATYQMQATTVVKIMDSRPTLQIETPEGDPVVEETGDNETVNVFGPLILIGVLILLVVFIAILTIKLSKL